MVNGVAVQGEDGSRQGVFGGFVHQRQGLVPVGVFVDEYGKHRSEDFLDHGGGLGVRGDHDGRCHKVPHGFVVGSSGQDGARRVLFGPLDVAGNFVKRTLINHSGEEIAQVAGGAHFDRGEFCHQLGLEGVGHGPGNVGAGCGRTFLALEFEGSAQGIGHDGIDVGRGVGHNEVLAAGFAYNPRVGFVLLQVVGNRFPQGPEHPGGSREMQSGKVAVRKDHVAEVGAVHRHQVDDPVGQSSHAEQRHHHVGRVNLRVCGLPHHGVAHQRRGSGQIAGDGREVEGRDGHHKAFQRTVFQPVPHAGRGCGLLGINVRHVLHVEAQKVRKLAGSVNFRLVRRLGLRQHGGRVDGGAVRSADQVRHLQKDRRALFPAQRSPLGTSRQGRIHRRLHVGLVPAVPAANHVVPVVRWRNVDRFSRPHFLPVDHHGNVDVLGVHFVVFGHQRFPGRRAGGVRINRFVDGGGNVKLAVGCHGKGVYRTGKQNKVFRKGRAESWSIKGPTGPWVPG